MGSWSIQSQVQLVIVLAMFSLIQLPNLQWIPKALSLSLSLQGPSPTQLARDAIQEKVRYFILTRHTILINSNRKRYNRHPQRVFKMLSQNCYHDVTSPFIDRNTIVIFMIYAFRSASSRGTPLTQSYWRNPWKIFDSEVHSFWCYDLLYSIRTFLKVELFKCSSPFTLLFSSG